MGDANTHAVTRAAIRAVTRAWVGVAFSVTTLLACTPTRVRSPAPPPLAPAAADWPAHGRDGDETRFSPLRQIDAGNVGQLGLAWHHSLRDGRGVEATPLVVDGVMYVTSAWSVVYALDARTGRERWVYDPQVDRRTGTRACCDAVNRGVAYAAGRVFVATLDGRLEALDARSGRRLWSQQTLVDTQQPYVITGAPRMARDLVLIGNSGADLGVRGYVSAYHHDTGRLAWRFYTVPGNPQLGPDGAASDRVLPMMAATWTGEWWRQGGGGTVWDSITYDAELDRVYIGVGNGSPWNRQVRSPGGGDNLFLASIVALDRATGDYRWHYQTTPGDTWDATATQTMTLTRLTIAGREHRVLLQAPKNGFFYVIDRDDGHLLSAGKLVPMRRTAETPPGAPLSWAYDIDLATGRPLENPEARYLEGQAVLVHPVGPGAHGWQPMAFNPEIGLVYLPVQDFASRFSTDPDYRPRPWTRASGLVNPGGIPQDAALRARLPQSLQARLVAWNPLTQQEAWRVPQDFAGNGGVLATAGNLVFQSDATGEFVGYDARDGRKLWAFDAQATAQGGPISYAVDGEQYIAIAVGNGGSGWLAGGLGVPALANLPTGRVLAFKLGGNTAYPRISRQLPPVPEPPPLSRDATVLKTGATLFGTYCAGCHGFGAISGHVTPDLRRSGFLQSAEAFRQVVQDGLLEARGMPRFGEALTAADLEHLRAWLADEARFERGLSR